MYSNIISLDRNNMALEIMRKVLVSILVYVIYQRRRMNGDHTYLAFLDLKKAYDSVTIYNILTKLYNMGIYGNTYIFLTNLYLTSKAHATHHGNQSKDFTVHRGVR